MKLRLVFPQGELAAELLDTPTARAVLEAAGTLCFWTDKVRVEKA